MALTIVLAAGCGGDDDDAGDDTAAEAADAADSAGDTDAERSDGDGGGTSDGSEGGGSGDTFDFPIPIPDGLVLDVLLDTGIPMDGQRQLYFENDDFDRIVSFYDEWTSENGSWARGEAEGSVTYQDLDVDATQIINVAPDHDPGAQADGPVTIVLLVSDR